jgi:hypothetical protein
MFRVPRSSIPGAIATRISLAFAALTFIITAALAQQFGPGSFDLTWNTIDGGGGTSTGGTFVLSGTIGQPDASGPLSGGTFTVVGGFWPGGVVPAPTCPGDITGDDLVNIVDLLAVVSAWGACPAPPLPCPADIAPPNGDGLVNIADLLAVIAAWGSCP